jgi:hypothetical protein
MPVKNMSVSVRIPAIRTGFSNSWGLRECRETPSITEASSGGLNMAKKRGNHEDTIVKRKDSRWMASITIASWGVISSQHLDISL